MPSLEANTAICSLQRLLSPLQQTEDSIGPSQSDNDDLSTALYEVFKRVPQVRQTLQKLISFLRTRKTKDETAQDKASYHRMARIATGCAERAMKMQEVFMQVAEIEELPELKSRYKSVVGRGQPVEGLMKGVIEGVLKLARESPAGIFSLQEIEDLEEALEVIGGLAPSLEQDTGGHSFNNYGPGPQNVHLGSGHQNINTGVAPQFNGQFHAPFQFPQGAFQGTGGTAGNC
ncbi:hypothetical protein B0T14DRAFT_565939 [Immersiella caudata]|uniref:NACHT-NTPase and P-loop NTPases N-terminal domain-containing protein n=1 Tax=Immersiella caudata TaxID=314043 RepID=A0AA40BZ21_9PEZI|nr:hypothetical protein B0T14DRAFT_565939 [Immersiella caudata]